MERTTAILINRHRLTETSLIVQWCSAEAGIFKTVAKGALRAKSVFAGRLELLVSCEVVWVSSRSSDLHVLKEVSLLEPRMGLRGSYLRVLAGAYFCKLLEMVAETQTPLPGLYGVLELALGYLDEHEPSWRLVTRFEDRLCVELGLGHVKEGDGGKVLVEMFHRQLPVQRKGLMEEFEKAARLKTDGI